MTCAPRNYGQEFRQLGYHHIENVIYDAESFESNRDFIMQIEYFLHDLSPDSITIASPLYSSDSLNRIFMLAINPSRVPSLDNKIIVSCLTIEYDSIL